MQVPRTDPDRVDTIRPGRRTASTFLVVALVLVVVLVDLTLTGWGPAGLPDCMLCTAMVLAGVGMVLRLRPRVAEQGAMASDPSAQVMLRQWCASGAIAGMAGVVAEAAVIRAAVQGHPWSFASLDLAVAGVVFGAGGAWLTTITARAIRTT